MARTAYLVTIAASHAQVLPAPGVSHALQASSTIQTQRLVGMLASRASFLALLPVNAILAQVHALRVREQQLTASLVRLVVSS